MQTLEHIDFPMTPEWDDNKQIAKFPNPFKHSRKHA